MALFNGFWHGPPLGWLRSKCLQTFLERGHQFHLYVYDDVEVPTGIQLQDARSILPADDIFYFERPDSGLLDIAPFSDLFRWKLLAYLGGWYCDVDTICLSSHIQAPARAWARDQQAWARSKSKMEPNVIANGQMAFVKNDPIATELFQRSQHLIRTGFKDRSALGPDLITSVIESRRLPLDMYGTPETFYPIKWVEGFKLWLPVFREEIRERLVGAEFLPLYQSFYEDLGLSQNRTPPRGSYLADLSGTAYMDAAQEYVADEIVALVRKYFEANKRWALPELLQVSGRYASGCLNILGTS
jgi:hypothetical protein